MSEPPQQFDQAYYQRFYADDATRATSPEEQARQARFIASYLNYLEVPMRRIVDLGCGTGALLHGLAAEFPDADCVGVEASDYLCDQYGWRSGSVVDFRARPFDLVVCTDVLGYLNDTHCTRAIGNIARLSRSAAYVSVLTEEDLDICDRERTDMRQTVRPAAWYRGLLEPHFVSVGGGLLLKRPLVYPVWQLERA